MTAEPIVDQLDIACLLEDRAIQRKYAELRHRVTTWQPRVYMSRSGAKKRADLLEKWGCTVTIERSHEVTWPT